VRGGEKGDWLEESGGGDEEGRILWCVREVSRELGVARKRDTFGEGRVHRC